MKRGLKFLLVTMGLFLVTISIVSQASYYGFNLKLEINDSYYTDADQDQVADDIITEFEIEIEYDDEIDVDDNKYNCLYRIELYISLVLPSGKTYDYNQLVTTDREAIDATLYFFNHVTESGWYKVSIYAELRYDITAFDEMIFDPPEERESTDPPSIKLVY